jgi:hypothetical protein
VCKRHYLTNPLIRIRVFNEFLSRQVLGPTDCQVRVCKRLYLTNPLIRICVFNEFLSRRVHRPTDCQVQVCKRHHLTNALIKIYVFNRFLSRQIHGPTDCQVQVRKRHYLTNSLRGICSFNKFRETCIRNLHIQQILPRICNFNFEQHFQAPRLALTPHTREDLLIEPQATVMGLIAMVIKFHRHTRLKFVCIQACKTTTDKKHSESS